MNEWERSRDLVRQEASPGGVVASRVCLLVLGMHRSGTSALTRVLSLLGAELPKNLHGADKGNETGHWEPIRLVHCHNALLAACGSNWRDWRPLDLSVLTPARRAAIKTEIRGLIEAEYGDTPLFVLKDPRICRFVPLYAELLSEAGIEPRYVIPVRNPLEVADSLCRRNGISLAEASLLWLRHTLDVEAATRGRPRVFLSYEDLLGDWRASVDRLTEALAVSWPCEPSDVEGQVDGFLASAQRHHARTVDELGLNPLTREWLSKAYASLLSLERNLGSDAALTTLDAIRAELDRAMPFLAAHAQEISTLRAATKSKDDALDAVRRELAQARAAELQLQSAIDGIMQSTSWRITEPLRFTKKALLKLKHPQRLRRALIQRLRANSFLGNVRRRRNRLTAFPSVRDAFIQQVLSISSPTPGDSTEYVHKSPHCLQAERIPIKVIAFYLPQFHPIPENDAWWGKGFTEWTNVTKAVPQFLGHYQPHLPGELGFYDLRLVDVMRQQAELARHYGISGFCFHHYWFAGKRLLERPALQLLANKDIDFPFCFCWANESWTRRWDGQERDVLMAQSHSADDDIAFIDHLIPYFRDERYIRFQDKPLLIVYRASLLPEPEKTAARWRERCEAAGVGAPYLIAARSFEVSDPRPFDFDAALEFPPHQGAARRINSQVDVINPSYKGSIYDYQDLAAFFSGHRASGFPLIKTVAPGWDNEARRPGAGHTFHGASPAVYARWLRSAVEQTVERLQTSPDTPPYVFVNAWNEWAEGAHLEPDRRFGYAYLHATAGVLQDFIRPDPGLMARVERSQREFAKRSDTAVILHLYYEDLWDELASHVSNASGADVFISLRRDAPAAVADKVLSDFPRARLSCSRNRGRDIYPFLLHLSLVSELNYAYVCKVHGKKSLYRYDGPKLRKNALKELLGSPDAVNAIKQRFASDPKLGLLAPPGSILDLSERDRNVLNRRWLDTLYQRLGLSQLVGTYAAKFTAGSMFWFRPDALKPLLDLGLDGEDFEDELGQIDGTLAHAVERLFATCAAKGGYTLSEIASDR